MGAMCLLNVFVMKIGWRSLPLASGTTNAAAKILPGEVVKSWQARAKTEQTTLRHYLQNSMNEIFNGIYKTINV